MVEYEELRLRLLESEKTVKNLKEALAIDTLKGDIAELEKESAKPDFWGRYGKQPKGYAENRLA